MKKILFLTTIILFFASQVTGQKNRGNFKKINTGNSLELSYRVVNKKGEDQAFLSIEQMPKFPGGYNALIKFMNKTLVYPETAIRDNVQGIVITKFSIDRSGNVRNIMILKGVRKDLNQESLRVIRMMPKWTTTEYIFGEDIMIQYTLPIKFSLK